MDAARLVASHRLFAVLLVLGGAMRVITQMAYRPALLVIRDSPSYLRTAADLQPHPVRPVGYGAFLKILPAEADLAVVPLVQHLLGLGIASAIYVLLLRLGVTRRLAAVATVPLLFDAMQLNLEQQILTEALFQACVIAAVAFLLWHRRPSWLVTALAGLASAAAVLTRANGLLIIVPLVIAALLLRVRARAIVAMAAAFLVPLAGYAAWFHSHHGVYALSASNGRFLYGRAAAIVDCDAVALPDYERQLCPREPLGQRLSPNAYMWSADRSPRYNAVPPAGMTLDQMESDFAKRVFRQQPMDFLFAVAYDFARGFQTPRSGARIERWMFHPTYPQDRHFAKMLAAIRAHGGDGAYAEPGLARFLTAYQRFVVTPGWLLFAFLVAAAAAVAGLGRARGSGLRIATFVFAEVTLAYLGLGAISVFSWRYQVMQLVLLPPAAALAFTALTSGPAHPRRRGADGNGAATSEAPAAAPVGDS